MEFLKKNWFIISFVVAPLMTGLVFLLSLNSRIFDSPQQKVEHDTHVKTALSPIQQQRKYLLDSMDKASAIEKRAITLKNDSIERERERINDSIMLDYVQKNAEQIYQIKQLIEQ
jgi:hypothetical protein